MHSTRQFVLFVLILGTLTALGPLTIDMYLPAFPAIGRDFAALPSTVELSLSVFLLGLALGQLFYGSIADRFGRKRPLYGGLVVYILTSIACVFVDSIEHLILLRFLQAVGMSAGMVISRTMVRDLFDHTDSARVFSLLMLVMGLAPILAPLAGGHIMIWFGWHAIFWVLSAAGLLCLCAVIFLLPETRHANPDVKLRRTFHVYRDILCDPSFLGFALTGGLAMAGLFVYITGSPFVYMHYFNITPQAYSWIFGLNAMGLIIVSQINARLVRHYAPDKILGGALIGLAVAGLWLMACGIFHLGLIPLTIGLFCFLALLGMIAPNAMATALLHQGGRAGSASALAGTLQFAFAALASTLLSFLHAQDPLPMTVIVGSCGVFAMLVYSLQKNQAAAKQPS